MSGPSGKRLWMLRDAKSGKPLHTQYGYFNRKDAAKAARDRINNLPGNVETCVSKGPDHIVVTGVWA